MLIVACMPKLARETLIQQMQRSGLLARFIADARVLFGKTLYFHDWREKLPTDGRVSASLCVGAVELGWISLPACKDAQRCDAYRRWLQMYCRSLAEELASMRVSHDEAMPASVLRATRIIREQCGHSLSLGDVAKEAGLSRERLSRLFHLSLGITFSNYLNEVRLDEARRQLVSGSRTITEVAYSSGFQSLSQFNRRFKAAEGITPSLYRKRCGKA